MDLRSTTERLSKVEAAQTEMQKSLEEILATLSDVSRSMKALQEKAIDKPKEGEQPTSGGEKGNPQPVVSLQLPPFSGADPIGWLARANQQFEINKTGDGQKVAIAVVAMEESTLYWVTWFRSRKPELSWEEFSKAMVSRFDTRFKGNPFERLADVKQSGSVEDYINLFVQLAGQVPGLSDEHYLGYFMKGLADSVRGALRLLRPKDLETAMELARDVEDNLALQSGGRANSGIVSTPVRANSNPRPTFGTNSGSETTPDNSTASEQNAKQQRFTRLSPNDYADLRAKGLCFRCKKPYTPQHECPLKQLRVLLAEEDGLLDFSYIELLENVRSFDPGDPNKYT